MLKKIGIFLFNLIKGFAYYESSLLRFVSGLIVLCGIAFILIDPTNQKSVYIKYFKPVYIVFCICFIIKEFLTSKESEHLKAKLFNLETTQEEIIESKILKFRESILHSILVYFGRFFDWKSGTRFTIFILDNKDGKEVISAKYRTVYGSTPGFTEPHNLCFPKKIGLPGMAWSDAWDKEKLPDLIDKIQVANVPQTKLSDESKLRDFYKKEFNLNDHFFDTLSSEKLTIRSYLAVGVVDRDNKLSFVLSVDSDKEGLFDDFDKAKREKHTKVMGIESSFRSQFTSITKETANSNAVTVPSNTNSQNALSIPDFEIPEDQLKDMPSSGKDFAELLNNNIKEYFNMNIESIIKAGMLTGNSVDRQVFIFGKLLELIEIVLQKR